MVNLAARVAPPLIENTTRTWPDGTVSLNDVCEPDTPVIGDAVAERRLSHGPV
jgi:hypothetical protein